jgi:hypothetical protein
MKPRRSQAGAPSPLPAGACARRRCVRERERPEPSRTRWRDSWAGGGRGGPPTPQGVPAPAGLELERGRDRALVTRQNPPTRDAPPHAPPRHPPPQSRIQPVNSNVRQRKTEMIGRRPKVDVASLSLEQARAQNNRACVNGTPRLRLSCLASGPCDGRQGFVPCCSPSTSLPLSGVLALRASVLSAWLCCPSAARLGPMVPTPCSWVD